MDVNQWFSIQSKALEGAFEWVDITRLKEHAKATSTALKRRIPEQEWRQFIEGNTTRAPHLHPRLSEAYPSTVSKRQLEDFEDSLPLSQRRRVAFNDNVRNAQQAAHAAQMTQIGAQGTHISATARRVTTSMRQTLTPAGIAQAAHQINYPVIPQTGSHTLSATSQTLQQQAKSIAPACRQPGLLAPELAQQTSTRGAVQRAPSASAGRASEVAATRADKASNGQQVPPGQPSTVQQIPPGQPWTVQQARQAPGEASKAPQRPEQALSARDQPYEERHNRLQSVLEGYGYENVLPTLTFSQLLKEVAPLNPTAEMIELLTVLFTTKYHKQLSAVLDEIRQGQVKPFDGPSSKTLRSEDVHEYNQIIGLLTYKMSSLMQILCLVVMYHCYNRVMARGIKAEEIHATILRHNGATGARFDWLKSKLASHYNVARTIELIVNRLGEGALLLLAASGIRIQSDPGEITAILDKLGKISGLLEIFNPLDQRFLAQTERPSKLNEPMLFECPSSMCIADRLSLRSRDVPKQQIDTPQALTYQAQLHATAQTVQLASDATTQQASMEAKLDSLVQGSSGKEPGHSIVSPQSHDPVESTHRPEIAAKELNSAVQVVRTCQPESTAAVNHPLQPESTVSVNQPRQLVSTAPVDRSRVPNCASPADHARQSKSAAHTGRDQINTSIPATVEHLQAKQASVYVKDPVLSRKRTPSEAIHETQAAKLARMSDEASRPSSERTSESNTDKPRVDLDAVSTSISVQHKPVPTPATNDQGLPLSSNTHRPKVILKSPAADGRVTPVSESVQQANVTPKQSRVPASVTPRPNAVNSPVKATPKAMPIEDGDVIHAVPRRSAIKPASNPPATSPSNGTH